MIKGTKHFKVNRQVCNYEDKYSYAPEKMQVQLLGVEKMENHTSNNINPVIIDVPACNWLFKDEADRIFGKNKHQFIAREIDKKVFGLVKKNKFDEGTDYKIGNINKITKKDYKGKISVAILDYCDAHSNKKIYDFLPFLYLNEFERKAVLMVNFTLQHGNKHLFIASKNKTELPTQEELTNFKKGGFAREIKCILQSLGHKKVSIEFHPYANRSENNKATIMCTSFITIG